MGICSSGLPTLKAASVDLGKFSPDDYIAKLESTSTQRTED